MSAPSLLPPPDLLQQVEGIESGLRKGRRIGIVGWIAFVVSAVQVVVLVSTSPGWSALRTFDWALLVDQWPLYLSLFVLALSLLLISWNRFWLKESREPFRYTFSIENFGPGPDDAPEGRLVWLRHDLLEKLSTRIGRLSHLDEKHVADDAGQSDTSHIHVSGSYAIRQTPEDEWIVRIHPWIRVGARGRPASLAHFAPFRLIREPVPSGRPSLTESEYQQVLERTYFSVATEIYKQIRQDVQRKIELLPWAFFRASAYFHEAEDYARSNTLDAYNDARSLYEAAVQVYDRRWRPLSESRWRRPFQRLSRRYSDGLGAIRQRAAWIFPRMGGVGLMIARAHLGYANTLLYRRILAGLSGERINPVFEALPVADRARRMLENLPEDVPGQTATLFDAYVTCALASSQLDATSAANRWLDRARREQPIRAEDDARFLFVRGDVEERLMSAIQFFRRAAELDPKFEVAQFELANSFEMLWRTRSTFESGVAEMVFEEYKRVVTDNPGNIAAWANIGYMRWLLEQRTEAKHAYDAGRDYKEIKRETFVAELDYGLARISAEEGRFKDAYEHYIAAASAQIAEGVSHAPDGSSGYQFAYIDQAMLKRYADYLDRVVNHWQAPSRDAKKESTPRVRDSVYAFVLNDYGEACLSYYLRSGDTTYLEKAERSFLYAADELKTKYLLVYYNLYLVSKNRGEDGSRYIEKVIELEPNWPDGNLEMVLNKSNQAKSLRQEATRQKKDAAKMNEDATKMSEDAERRRGAPSPLDQRTLVPAGASPQPAPYSLALEQRLVAAERTAAQTAGLFSSDDPEARRLREDAKALKAEAEALDAEANRWHEEAGQLEKAAHDLPKALLPHRWLWSTPRRRGARYDEADDRRWFLDPGILTLKEFERELKWEREFDDFHVRALFTWCKTLPSQVGGELADGGIPTVDPRELLVHIRRHFWPNDFELLLEYRDLCAAGDDEAGESTGKLLAAIVDRWLTREPAAFWALTWVDERAFDRDRIRATFAKIADQENLSPFLYRWLGDQLRDLGDNSGALTAYRNERAGRLDPDSLVDLGTQIETVGGWQDALHVYEAAEAAEVEGERARSAAFYRWRIGRVRWALSDYEGASRDFASIGEGDVGVDLDWRIALVDELKSAGELDRATCDRYLRPWLEGDHLASVSRSVSTRKDAAGAILALVRSCWSPTEGGAGADDALAPLVVRAMSLQADANLFPERPGDIPEAARRMIEDDIPEIKMRVRLETGVSMPGISIRASRDTGEGGYRILLNEVPYATGVVAAGHLYCEDAEACRARGLYGRPASDLAQGAAGIWLPSDAVKGVDMSGLSLLNPYRYMLEQVAAVFRGHLELFLDFEAARRLVDEWQSERYEPAIQAERKARLESAIPDDAALARFAQMLARMVAEGVVIDDLGALLGAFGSAGGPLVEVETTVEAARNEIVSKLPGTDGSRGFVRLSPVFEKAVASGIKTRDGKRFLALTPGELEPLREELCDLVGDHSSTLVLVVQADGLRPFVRRVVDLYFASVPVLAEAELVAAQEQASVPAAAWRER